ncbi:hypothetical protein DFH94DRAFT_141233 [Russula ochroleuca]|uniref:Uncharacterized protein n=1 Tax=Russula ochroleuca TaxID=152965 RepID=A0A9P5K1M5_9AGAM|nr:hypothetical protein DFH94DRAFT_141233 [Russula ochroleuca]
MHTELEKNSPYSSPVMTTLPRIALYRPPSPVFSTPRRHLSPVPSSSSESSSPILKARRLSMSPSPLVLSSRVASPSADIARQIAAITQDLAGLRGEEQRLLHSRAQPEQAVRPIMISTMPRCGSLRALIDPSFCTTRMHRRMHPVTAELAASTAREAALREMLEPLPVPAPVPTENDVFADGEDDSEPMDLATLLQPTVLLDPDDL